MTSEPNTGVALLDANGDVCYINQQSANIYFGEGTQPKDVIGRNLRDLFPPEWVEDRNAVLNRVRNEGKPILFRTIWHGRQHHAWVYPVRPGEDPAGPITRLLIITRRGGDGDGQPRNTDGFELIESKVVDLGQLGSLTPRELVVLALLGRGMSIKEVAEHLYRSEKTIQTQRDSISRKLNLRNRAELVKLVQNVGLNVEDAQRINVEGE
ncbi:MAG: PAS domain-containing protein [Planctomycetes bacterium]|jgi:DNA-binding CsgD family transcriptional regulator|nr:PAS domain-containing protein [Planctomycetota bacterium]